MVADTMDTRQAAAYLHLHPRTLERKARAGLVPAARTGRKWLFRREELDLWASRMSGGQTSAGDREDDAWAELAARELAGEYSDSDEGLYDDPEALGARRVTW